MNLPLPESITEQVLLSENVGNVRYNVKNDMDTIYSYHKGGFTRKTLCVWRTCCRFAGHGRLALKTCGVENACRNGEPTDITLRVLAHSRGKAERDSAMLFIKCKIFNNFSSFSF